MRLVFLVLALCCIAAGILFGALNAQDARVDFYWFSLQGSLGAMLLVSAFLGAAAAGLALVLGVVWPLQRRLARARRASAPAAATLPVVPSDALLPTPSERP